MGEAMIGGSSLMALEVEEVSDGLMDGERLLTGIDRKTLAADRSLVDVALNHSMEHMTKEIAIAKSAIAVLRERRMIWHPPVEVQPSEPAIGQVQMNILTKATLGADPIAVTDEQHTDHQLRIHGRPADLGVERLQILPDVLEIDKDLDLAQQMIGRNMIVEAKIVKQRLGSACLPIIELLSKTKSSTDRSHVRRSQSTADFFINVCQHVP